jgi:hypothetical protein
VKIMSAVPQRGTSAAICAFDSGQQEATMPFSMPSYFLGVGTVVGALAFGFGGGVLLTKTAIKEPVPSRLERAARADPPPAPRMGEAREGALRAAPSTVAASTPEPAPQAAVENPTPAAETPRQEPVRVAEPIKQPEAPKQAEQRLADAPKQIEQREVEPQLTEREQRRVERRIEREKRTAERKARAMASYARMRQRPVDDPQQQERQPPARPELAFEREEPRPNLFEGLFGRPQEAAPAERE